MAHVRMTNMAWREWFKAHNMNPTRFVYCYEFIDGEWITEPYEGDTWEDAVKEAASACVFGTGDFVVYDLESKSACGHIPHFKEFHAERFPGSGITYLFELSVWKKHLKQGTELWKEFRLDGKLLCAYSLEGEDSDEEAATVGLVACENGVSESDIKVRIVERAVKRAS